MADERPGKRSINVWTQILTDIHFWVPVIVLLAGLVVLHWMQ
ncbi:MAG TPA: hypothetical protein VE077_10360 [Candidatus Methylomirabilis sp.]|nr:hypothetical protein [Candidatus Methylomirabilis sp.]